MIEIKAQNFLGDGIVFALHAQFDIKYLKTIPPVLPVMSSQHTSVPFITCNEMLDYNADKNLPLWELAVHYESARGNLSHEQVFQQMSEIVRLCKNPFSMELPGQNTPTAFSVINPGSSKRAWQTVNCSMAEC